MATDVTSSPLSVSTISSFFNTTINNTYNSQLGTPSHEFITGDDAAWALTCAFLILTMQTGFAMLECGCVSAKNVANIMIKNVVDVSLGGLTYWMFGYGISFGQPSNAFMGMGGWFFSHEDESSMGSVYSHYFFQLSFATTATTIVSGAVAERMNLHAYMVFSLVNTVVYCFPASWAWNGTGFLAQLGFFDFAGSCVCHLCGGSSALVAVIMLGPRLNRFDDPDKFQMSSPVTCLTGMFMLWWAWLGFNCGSTFGVSGDLWKISALVAVTTTNGGIGGGLAGLSLSMAFNDGKILVGDIVNSCLGGLVGITAAASVCGPAEAMFIGFAGGCIGLLGTPVMNYFKLDDPVGAIPVHLFSAFWGTIAVGLFGQDNTLGQLGGRRGLFHGGGMYQLGVQLLGATCIGCWAGSLTFGFLFITNKIIHIRMKPEEEILGADWCEHDLRSEGLTLKLESALRSLDNTQLDRAVTNVVKDMQDKPAAQRITNWDKTKEHFLTQRRRTSLGFGGQIKAAADKTDDSALDPIADTVWSVGLYSQIFSNAISPGNNEKEVPSRAKMETIAHDSRPGTSASLRSRASINTLPEVNEP